MDQGGDAPPGMDRNAQDGGHPIHVDGLVDPESRILRSVVEQDGLACLQAPGKDASAVVTRIIQLIRAVSVENPELESSFRQDLHEHAPLGAHQVDRLLQNGAEDGLRFGDPRQDLLQHGHELNELSVRALGHGILHVRTGRVESDDIRFRSGGW